ncbi:hypothetical protein GQ53DRAFT_699818 [Thozetella sp. PMI_491]|nr:hypothetical protein GQ53DRAFT_699818 [Thozetella sp. PMI_491]
MPTLRKRKRPQEESESRDEMIEFDSLGDLILDVGPDQSRFLVCSKSLSRASAAWKTMFYGPFAEAKPTGEAAAKDWVVQLPEDDPTALTIILDIIHGRFDDIPQTLEVDALLNLTILTDKYDLAHLLRPWAKGWLDFIRTHEGSSSNESLLWIAWELGDVTMFRDAVWHILKSSRINRQGALINSDGEELQEVSYLASFDILGHIAKIRTATIRKLGSKPKEYHDRLLCSEPTAKTCAASAYYLTPREHTECRMYMLGNLSIQLNRVGLYPFALDHVTMSIDEFYTAMTTVLNGIETLSNHSHSICSPASHFRKNLDHVYNNMPGLLGEAHISHLLTQRKKTGLV